MNNAATATRAVVIVAYNNEDGIADCLAAVFADAPARTAAVVVDNSPTDATADRVAAYRDGHPDHEITLIRRPDNIGFAAGCNLGAKGRAEDYLVFLNPDTKPEADALSRLVAFLGEHPPAAIAGPQIRNESGGVVRTCRNLPTPFRVLCDASGLDALLGRYRLTRFDHAEPRQVDQIIGACLCMRRADFEALGGFDERFFIYYEEVDFCKRALDAGREVWFRPEAVVVHLGGVSTEAPAAISRMPGYLRRSRAQYFAKHYGPTPQWIVLAATLAECLAKAAVLTVMAWLRKDRAPYLRSKRNGFLAVVTEWRHGGK